MLKSPQRLFQKPNFLRLATWDPITPFCSMYGYLLYLVVDHHVFSFSLFLLNSFISKRTVKVNKGAMRVHAKHTRIKTRIAQRKTISRYRSSRKSINMLHRQWSKACPCSWRNSTKPPHTGNTTMPEFSPIIPSLSAHRNQYQCAPKQAQQITT